VVQRATAQDAVDRFHSRHARRSSSPRRWRQALRGRWRKRAPTAREYPSEKERAVGAGLAAVSADGLGDGDDNRRPISSLIAFRVLDFSRSARCARTSLRARFLWRSRQDGRRPGRDRICGSRGADGPAREAGDAPSRTITACRRFGRIILEYGRFLVISDMPQARFMRCIENGHYWSFSHTMQKQRSSLPSI